MEVFDDRAGFYACSSFAGVGNCQKHLNYNTIEAKECVKTSNFQIQLVKMWNWKVLIVGKNMISSLFACLRRRPRGRRPHKSAHKGCSVENFELLEKEKILLLPEATNLVGLCDGRSVCKIS
jgi:hypothetical protein